MGGLVSDSDSFTSAERRRNSEGGELCGGWVGFWLCVVRKENGPKCKSSPLTAHVYAGACACILCIGSMIAYSGIVCLTQSHHTSPCSLPIYTPLVYVVVAWRNNLRSAGREARKLSGMYLSCMRWHACARTRWNFVPLAHIHLLWAGTSAHTSGGTQRKRFCDFAIWLKLLVVSRPHVCAPPQRQWAPLTWCEYVCVCVCAMHAWAIAYSIFHVCMCSTPVRSQSFVVDCSGTDRTNANNQSSYGWSTCVYVCMCGGRLL